MPVRKRKDRHKQSAGLDAWECVFASEFDLFGDLRDAGVETDTYGRPNKDEARAAWKRFGSEFLSTFRDSHVPWALEQFGDP